MADLIGLGWLAFVEQKQRDGELVGGVAELAGSWPGDPTQTQALRLAFKGDVWAGIRAIDRDLDGLPLGRAAPELFLGSIGRSAVIPPGDGGLQGGALLKDEAQAKGRGKPAAAGVGLVKGVVGVVVLFLLLQAVGGPVAGFFASEIGEGELFILRGAAGLLLEHMGHQEARGVPDRRWLGQVLMATGDIVPAGADQIQAQGVDQVLADLGGGGHGSAAASIEFTKQLGAVTLHRSTASMPRCRGAHRGCARHRPSPDPPACL